MSGPFVSLQPGMRSGRPTLNGTRLPVEIVAEVARANGVDSVVATYGDTDFGINRPAVLVACWYMALYGTRRWRGWWRPWADENAEALWLAKWDDIPDPPMQEKS